MPVKLNSAEWDEDQFLELHPLLPFYADCTALKTKFCIGTQHQHATTSHRCGKYLQLVHNLHEHSRNHFIFTIVFSVLIWTLMSKAKIENQTNANKANRDETSLLRCIQFPLLVRNVHVCSFVLIVYIFTHPHSKQWVRFDTKKDGSQHLISGKLDCISHHSMAKRCRFKTPHLRLAAAKVLFL